MKDRHLRIGFLFAVFVALVTLGLFASAQEDFRLFPPEQEDEPLPDFPEGWIAVGDNLAIMFVESDGGGRVGRLMLRNGRFWSPIYLESMPTGIRYLNQGSK